MSRTENVELTVVCLLEDGGKILLQDRVKTDWHGYALPGDRPGLLRGAVHDRLPGWDGAVPDRGADV